METMSGSPAVGVVTPTPDRRAEARQRSQAQRDFMSHLALYVLINVFLIGVWTPGTYFWPAWVLAVWGAGLVLHGWKTFLHRPIFEADIDGQLNRHR
jgi:hypothetical protein